VEGRLVPGSTNPSRLGRLWSSVGLPARLALRGLGRAPGTSVLAVLVLTLGLAAPVTFFSILVGALRPLPVPDGDRVIRVEAFQPVTGGGEVPVTLRDLELLRGASSLEALGGFRLVEGTLVDEGRTAARVSGSNLTPDVLPLLRIAPLLGRIPTPDEADRGLLLGFELWQESYDGDPGVLGREVRFNDEFRVITGVLPEGFGFPFNQNLWILLGEGSPDDEPVQLVGRLAQGSSLDRARVELSGRWQRGDAERSPPLRGGVLEVDSFTGGRGETGEGIAFLGLVLVALALLVIACANVANLLLVRASERVRSLGIQSALGASRLHLSAQLFFEALLLAVLGGVGGLLLAWMGVGAIQRSLASEHFGYFWMRMAVDGRVMAFSFLLIGGTAVFAGMLPILRILKADLQGVLKEGAGDSVVSRGGAWNRRFVTTQLALSCAALVAAGLTGTSLARSGDFGVGVPALEILVAYLDPMPEAGSADVDWVARIDALTEALGSGGGAESAALALGAPGYFEPFGRFEVVGEEAEREVDRQGVGWNAVTPGFFSLLDMEILQGRGIRSSDIGNDQPVAVVSEAFAARYFPQGESLGRELKIFEADTANSYAVMGVVQDVDMGGGPSAPRERIYLSLLQLRRPTLLALVRSGAGGVTLAPTLPSLVAEIDPGIPVWSVRTLSDAHAFMIRIPRAMASVALAGGLGGLLVAAVGLYALLAFRVRQRRKELGVRLALGADGRRLAREVIYVALRQLLPAVALGLGFGLVGAPVRGGLLQSANPRSPVA
jgi:putative ABC transport system permease protein